MFTECLYDCVRCCGREFQKKRHLKCNVCLRSFKEQANLVNNHNAAERHAHQPDNAQLRRNALVKNGILPFEDRALIRTSFPLVHCDMLYVLSSNAKKVPKT